MSSTEGFNQFDAVLRQPATQQELNALVAQTGNLFAQAHLAKGNIAIGDDLPDVSSVGFGRSALHSFPLLKQWDHGEVHYTSPILAAEVRDDGEVILPPSVLLLFNAKIPGTQRSTVSRTLQLVPGTAEQKPVIQDHIAEIDETLISRFRGASNEEIRQVMAETWDQGMRKYEAEQAELVAAGLAHTAITKGELRDISQLMQQTVRPATIRIVGRQ